MVLRHALAGEFTSTAAELTAEDFLAALAAGSERLPALSTETFTRGSFYEDRV